MSTGQRTHGWRRRMVGMAIVDRGMAIEAAVCKSISQLKSGGFEQSRAPGCHRPACRDARCYLLIACCSLLCQSARISSLADQLQHASRRLLMGPRTGITRKLWHSSAILLSRRCWLAPASILVEPCSSGTRRFSQVHLPVRWMIALTRAACRFAMMLLSNLL